MSEDFMLGLDNLIGKRICGIAVTDEGQSITFNDENEILYVYRACADCCSHSWIEYVEDPENLIMQKVIKIEEKDISKEETEEYDWLDIMSYDIYTEKGICKIDFRNSSNGYYGGALEIVEIKKAEEYKMES